MVQRVGPVHQVIGGGHSHLGILALGVTEVVHPIFAVNFFGNNRARLRPFDIPFTLIAGHDYAFSVPMDQVLGSRQTQLRVFVIGAAAVHIVVAGIGQVVGLANLLQARIFHSTAFFIGCLGFQDRLGSLCEMNAVAARRIS